MLTMLRQICTTLTGTAQMVSVGQQQLVWIFPCMSAEHMLQFLHVLQRQTEWNAAWSNATCIVAVESNNSSAAAVHKKSCKLSLSGAFLNAKVAYG